MEIDSVYIPEHIAERRVFFTDSELEGTRVRLEQLRRLECVVKEVVNRLPLQSSAHDKP